MDTEIYSESCDQQIFEEEFILQRSSTREVLSR